MHIRSLILICAFFFSVGTPSVHAYFTTAQSAFSVDNKTTIYIIDYAFGHEKHALTMPVIAAENNTDVPMALTYTITDEDGALVPGTAHGIVLSSMKLIDGAYSVPRGTAGTFRLLVLHTRATDDIERDDVHLQVTHLPFAFTGTQDLKLNEPELRPYRAPSTRTQPSGVRILRTQ